jgi:hypothetical protein
MVKYLIFFIKKISNMGICTLRSPNRGVEFGGPSMYVLSIFWAQLLLFPSLHFTHCDSQGRLRCELGALNLVHSVAGKQGPYYI